MLFLAGCAAILPAATNSVTITELAGASQTNRPFTISRVFVQGEIAGHPQPRLGGTPITPWQADVKSRWPDGSVKHALVSFKASVASGATIAVDFVDNANPCSSGTRAACDSASMTAAQMLAFSAAAGGWGGKLEASASGIVQTADVRTMLQNGHFSYWLRGPVATQVIAEDRSPNLSYDFGWKCMTNCSGTYAGSTWQAAPSTSYQSLHPIFVATFYPGYTGVKVEYIVENTWANRRQDQNYSFKLYTGPSAGTLALSQPAFTQWARTRWRKTAWSGTTPPAVKIDYNLAYMVESRALPSFDLTKKVTSVGITAALNSWAATDKGAFFGEYSSGGVAKNGSWFKPMGTTGGREEIGVFPTWVARYLYTFHTTADGNSLYDIMIANAEVSGYVPIHSREDDATVKYCALSQECINAGLDGAGAFGRPLSRDAHPTGYPGTTVATLSNGHNWVADTAHQGSFAYVPYLITGDWYWLEEMNFWSARNLMTYPNGTTLYYQSHNDWAYISEQIRGMAWVWRTLGHSAFLSPDGTPEKSYFTQKLLNNIAIREGKHDVRDGYGFTADNVKWQWGYTRVSADQGNREQTTHIANPLNFVDPDEYASMDGIDTTVTKYITPQWQVNMLLVVLAHLDDLGYPVKKYHAAVAKNAINQVLNPAFNPYLIGNYRTPAMAKSTNTWFQTWGEMLKGYLPSEQVRTTWESGANNSDSGYPFYARAAAQFFDGIVDGPYTGTAARLWLNAHVAESGLNENPKWAFAPRSAVAVPSPASSPCDLNGDGRVDVSDVQVSVNKTLGTVPCTGGDLSQDGKCTVVDTQRTINAALGGVCRVGL